MIKEIVYPAIGTLSIVAVLGWMGYRDIDEAQAPQCPPPRYQQELIGSGHVESDGASVLRCIYTTPPAYRRLMAQR
jgi:hypothetical protein